MASSLFDQFADAAMEELTRHGFLRESEDRNGPMGSGEIRYFGHRLDVVLHSDRGLPAVTIGSHGGHTFTYQPWAELLGVEVDKDLDVRRQLGFLLEQACRIKDLIEGDPEINERLRELNWRVVKKNLGLDPNMPRPGAR